MRSVKSSAGPPSDTYYTTDGQCVGFLGEYRNSANSITQPKVGQLIFPHDQMLLVWKRRTSLLGPFLLAALASAGAF